MDMALALVEADLGAATANLIARHFVLYARRPGYQSQFSPMLQAQTTADAPFAALIDWMQDHLDRELDVPTLARHAGYSERSFYRKFTEATGKTPAHFVEDLRLDAARTLLSKGLSLKAIAGRVGLKSSARLGQAFERRFGKNSGGEMIGCGEVGPEITNNELPVFWEVGMSTASLEAAAGATSTRWYNLAPDEVATRFDVDPARGL